MQTSSRALLVLLATGAAWGPVARAAEVTPVQKVVELMNGMLAKGKKEKKDEQVEFAAFKQFCDDTTVETERLITEANEKIEVLKADIEKYEAIAARLTKEIAEHDADIAAWTGDMKAATIVRTLEKKAYDDLHQDYSESVDALQRAIEVLKKQAYDRTQASFAQVSALKTVKLLPDDARKVIDTFLQADNVASNDEGLAGAPEALGYEFQSHGIIEMLEKLLDKFIGERTEIEKQEMNNKHEFDLLISDLTAQTEQAKQDRDEKTKTKAKMLQNAADAKGELSDTIATRDEDQKYLDNLTATCKLKATDFESRQQLRAEEIVAVEKAIEIITSDSVAANADKHLPAMLQARGRSLAALRSETGAQEVRQKRVAEYLQKQARQTGSRVLSVLASRVEADPFEKVKKMIKDLIVRLMEEASDEAEHKGWCDTELSVNEQTRKEKTASVEILHAEADELDASIAKLAQELAALAAAIAELDKAMAEATTLRVSEKATNEETIADSQEAQTAVAQALVVLKEFYAKAAEATALVQQPRNPEVPAMYDEAYTGMGGEAGGVVGMLEVIESDFARLEADTKAAEAAAQKEYDGFMTDSKADKEAKMKDVEHKDAEKQDQQQALKVTKADLAGTQEELDASLAYFDKLKPSCIDAGVSYDDRVSRRKEEIESLQEALKILNGEDIAA